LSARVSQRPTVGGEDSIDKNKQRMTIPARIVATNITGPGSLLLIDAICLPKSRHPPELGRRARSLVASIGFPNTACLRVIRTLGSVLLSRLGTDRLVEKALGEACGRLHRILCTGDPTNPTRWNERRTARSIGQVGLSRTMRSRRSIAPRQMRRAVTLCA
jgi:hypothetical protein